MVEAHQAPIHFVILMMNSEPTIIHGTETMGLEIMSLGAEIDHDDPSAEW